MDGLDPILKRGTLLKDQRDFEDRWLSTFDFATYVFRQVYQLVPSLRGGRNPPRYRPPSRVTNASRERDPINSPQKGVPSLGKSAKNWL